MFVCNKTKWKKIRVRRLNLTIQKKKKNGNAFPAFKISICIFGIYLELNPDQYNYNMKPKCLFQDDMCYLLTAYLVKV